jgi:hypothetical protein
VALRRHLGPRSILSDALVVTPVFFSIAQAMATGHEPI